jgi:hypothetical protein
VLRTATIVVCIVEYSPVAKEKYISPRPRVLPYEYHMLVDLTHLGYLHNQGSIHIRLGWSAPVIFLTIIRFISQINLLPTRTRQTSAINSFLGSYSTTSTLARKVLTPLAVSHETIPTPRASFGSFKSSPHITGPAPRVGKPHYTYSGRQRNCLARRSPTRPPTPWKNF